MGIIYHKSLLITPVFLEMMKDEIVVN